MNTPRKPAGHEVCPLVPDRFTQGLFYCPEHKVGSLRLLPPEGNYGSMIRREGDGYDTGDDQGDPLVQEPS